MIASGTVQSNPSPSSYNPMAPWGYDYMLVRSNTFVSYTGFNGDVDFNINASESERWISSKNSYLSARLRIRLHKHSGLS